MTGVIATLPKFQFSSSTGVPLALGTLTVYLAGTTTPTDTWQDSALSALNTNPVQLDSSGSCVLWLDSTKSYKFILKNAAGAIQWTADNISGAASAALFASSVGASLVGYLPAGTGAVATTVQAKLRESVSVKDFGAVGDGVTDDTAAIAKWIVACAGKHGYAPTGRYLTSSEIFYNAEISGSITITGDGASSVFIASGVANKVFHIKGVEDVTVNPVVIRDIAIQSETSGLSDCGLHLEGIAHFIVDGVWINGKNKMSVGIKLSASQQGEISGGEIQNCLDGGVVEAASGVMSNGVDWHGMTFINTTANLRITAVDDIFFHSNHMTYAATQVVISGSGSGLMVIQNNHFEPLAGNNGIYISSGKVFISGNSFYGFAGTNDININSTSPAIIVNNLIVANVVFGAAATDCIFHSNNTGGIVTNNSTRLRHFNNYSFSGTPLVGGQLWGSLKINSQQAAAGDMLSLLPPAIAGDWGMVVEGAGASNDTYYRMGLAGPIIGGRTDYAGVINFKSAPGGALWGSFAPSGVRGAMAIATGAAAAVNAGEVGISGEVASTVGAAGAASALPANPSGYIIINVAGAGMKIPYYNS